MLSLAVRRALAQRRLVASVVALVAVAATLIGVCALLLGPTQALAFSRQVQRSQPQDVEVDAFLVELDDDDLSTVRDDTVEQLRSVLGSLDPSTTSVATSRLRDLEAPVLAASTEASGGAPGGSAQAGYLAAGDAIAPHAELVSGRWPAPATGTPEATVPATAARRLGVGVGDELSLGQATGYIGTLDPLTVVVVGTFRPSSSSGWESDPLNGAGFDPAYTAGSKPAATYGPFVVDDAAFRASGSPVARLRVSARPDLARADRGSVRAAVSALTGAQGVLTTQLGDRVRQTRVTSQLPATLERVEAQQGAGRSTVLVAVLLGAALSMAALLLAARLVAAVRDEERVLLVALGASPSQQVGAAGVESLLLAALAAVLALPSASLLHAWATHTAAPAAAGLGRGPALSPGLVLAVIVTSLALTPTLVSTALDPATTSAATRRRWALARTGADASLLAVAVVVAVLAWRQLDTQPPSTATRGDVTLIVAPVVCLLAVVAVAVRVVPLLLQAASRLALHSRSLVLPLSTQQAARRPHPGTAMLLVTAAVATATFGLGFRATWERSQADQAALRVGTDLSLTLGRAPTREDATAIADLTVRGGAVNASSAVVDRAFTLGRYAGDPDAPPTLVALDASQAGSLLRGRLDDGATWSALGARLQAGPGVVGPVLADGASLQGSTTNPLPITVTATAVVEDAAGVRRPLEAVTLPLDGTPHPLVWNESLTPGLRLVALSLHLDAPRPRTDVEVADAPLSVSVLLPDQQPGAVGDTAWHTPTNSGSPLDDSTVSLATGDGGTDVLRAASTVDTTQLYRDGADLLATAFEPPEQVPVAVSRSLARAVGAGVGDDLAGVVGDGTLPLRVVAVVPTVPSAPDRPAVLADTDTVSRALIAQGQLDSVVDAWWFADPDPATVQAVRGLHAGEVHSRREVSIDLSRGPLQVTVPTVLTVLVVAAVVLLLAGTALITGADHRRRSAELTRLRAMGLTRRGARRLLLAENATFLIPLMLLGVVVGTAASFVLAPLMVRSDLGAVPVPVAQAVFPRAAELVVLGAAAAGCALVVVVATVLQVRGSDTAGLRTGDA